MQRARWLSYSAGRSSWFGDQARRPVLSARSGPSVSYSERVSSSGLHILINTLNAYRPRRAIVVKPALGYIGIGVVELDRDCDVFKRAR